jgi:hypothetical protein
MYGGRGCEDSKEPILFTVFSFRIAVGVWWDILPQGGGIETKALTGEVYQSSQLEVE